VHYLKRNQDLLGKLCVAMATGNTKRGSITELMTSCLTGLESAVWQLTIFVFIFKTEQTKPVKQ
jgi:hypothetical protein